MTTSPAPITASSPRETAHDTTLALLDKFQRELDSTCAGLHFCADIAKRNLYTLGVRYFTTNHGAIMAQDGSGDLTFGYTLENGWQGVALCIYRPEEGWQVITEI